MNEYAKDLTPIEREITPETMLKELQTLNKISLLGEEDNVIRGILRGKSKKQIIDDIKLRNKNEKINETDIDNFMILYKDVLYSEKADMEKAYTRNLIKSQVGLTNKLIDLANQADLLIKKYDEQGDNSNAVNALKAAADIFMKVGKVQGVFVETPEVNINMKMDKMVNNITSKDSEFKKTILKVLEDEEKVIDVEVVDVTPK